MQISIWDTVSIVQFPATAEYFKGFFPDWSHSANSSWASVAENGSISPQRHHTTCGQRGGRPKFNHRRWLIEKKNYREPGWVVSAISTEGPRFKTVCSQDFPKTFSVHPRQGMGTWLSSDLGKVKVFFWYGPLASLSLQIANVDSDHHGKNNRSPRQWTIRVKITIHDC